METLRPNHKPSPYLFGAALAVAGLGLWTGRKVAYITSASMTLLAAGWMYRSADKEKVVRKPKPKAAKEEPESRSTEKQPQTPAKVVKPLPVKPQLHLNATLVNWCEEVTPQPEVAEGADEATMRSVSLKRIQDKERFQKAVEQAVKKMGDGDGLGRIVDGETKVLGYGIGEMHEGMAYLWKIEDGLFAEGGVKKGQFLGIRFKLSDALTASKKGCEATPLLVGIAEYGDMAYASVRAMQAVEKGLPEENRGHLLLPMEYFFMDDNTLLATPCERMDDDIGHVDLTLKQTVSLCRQVAEGINCLHLLPHEEGEGVGYVHGDIKPENIVCDEERTTAKIIDYDLLRKANKPPDGVQGMPWYLPRDYLESEKGSKDNSLPLDVYSFGVMLYAMVFGRGVEGLDWKDYGFFNAYRKMAGYDVEDPWEPLVPFQSFFGSQFVKEKEGVRLAFPEKWGKNKGGFHDKHLPKKGPAGIKELKALVQECMQRDETKRPLMSTVLERMKKIEAKVK